MADPSLSEWLAALSPAALDAATFGILFLEGLGVPVLPGVLPMLAQANAIDAGRTTFVAAVVWATLGDIAGALTVYVLGRWGTRFVPAAWRRALESPKAQRSLDRWGLVAVFFSRWLVSFRIPITLGAGVAKMRFRAYLTASVLGALLHIVLWQVLLGHFGPQIVEWLDSYTRYWPVLLVLLIAWAAFEVWRHRRSGSGGNTERV
ncbi:DedA family protein [Deinococcus yavapaiensis]|uniref:Membrane protein DedA with SNARE-associated domain n=1 Tax=Deinococcus yavapaiensis KR-236 TaxID=694435 RepID=A0A318S714_9DEIO|nr:DedA family protein [Deinococcus yavapaiensis]PYE54554.1 membrane protein DedA with SNARE-associated domain [Deinococcus yavapaiensis KR-236]